MHLFLLPLGTIPSSIGQLSRLTILALSENKLIGTSMTINQQLFLLSDPVLLRHNTRYDWKLVSVDVFESQL